MTDTKEKIDDQIQIFRDIAKRQKGNCLSITYRNSTTKLLFQCEKGHEWSAYPSNIKREHWCKRCVALENAKKTKDSLELFKKIAIEKGGVCLSDSYSNQNDKLLFECSNKHQWWGRPSKIKRGEWCRKCSYKIISEKNKLSIDALREIAESKGGKLLSQKYEKANKKLQWECGNGHQWWTTTQNIRAGRWCKKCSSKKAALKIKASIEDCKIIASNHEGLCLSTNYDNSQSNLIWQCKYGHIWQATYANVKKGTWCRICSNNKRGIKRRTPIEFFREYAASKGGTCLSDTYTGQKTKLLFKCEKGHTWTVGAGSIKGKKTWCPKCAGNYKATSKDLKDERLNDIKKIATANGGECLSTEYLNQNKKLKFKCSNGHIWWTIPSVIKRGSWCKKCATKRASDNQRDTLEIFKRIIESREGKCLTTEYKSQGETRILVECKNGHRWSAFPQHLKRGIWCRKCNGSAPHELKDVIKLAESRGGICLSTEYVNDMSKIIWKCAEGHIWEATPNNIKRGKWCPTCNSGIGERVCRLTLEKIFNVHFNKVRPSWLRNKAGFIMELDGYNSNLKLAFEHQGRQHYGLRTNSMFSKANLESNDKEKALICSEKGIKIVYIPEVFTETKLSEIVKVITNELDRLKVDYPLQARELALDSREVYTYTRTKEVQIRENRAIEILKQNGARPLEIFRVDSGVRVKVKCKQNHLLKTNISTILNGTVCKKCNGL